MDDRLAAAETARSSISLDAASTTLDTESGPA